MDFIHFIFSQKCSMPKAYSLDLRERILNDYDSGVPVEDIVAHYVVSRSWTYSLLKQRRETGIMDTHSPFTRTSRPSKWCRAGSCTPPPNPNRTTEYGIGVEGSKTIAGRTCRHFRQSRERTCSRQHHHTYPTLHAADPSGDDQGTTLDRNASV